MTVHYPEGQIPFLFLTLFDCDSWGNNSLKPIKRMRACVWAHACAKPLLSYWNALTSKWKNMLKTSLQERNTHFPLTPSTFFPYNFCLSLNSLLQTLRAAQRTMWWSTRSSSKSVRWVTLVKSEKMGWVDLILYLYKAKSFLLSYIMLIFSSLF